MLCTGAFYYISPISSAAQVLKEWDASSLSLPMLLLNAVASGVWALYGFVIMDPFVWFLNSFALLVSLFFIAVKMVLPSTFEKGDRRGKDDKNGEHKLPEDTHVIVGTVRTRGRRARTLYGKSEQPIRIAISSDSYQQLVRGSGANMGLGLGPGPGMGAQASSGHSRFGSNAANYSPVGITSGSGDRSTLPSPPPLSPVISAIHVGGANDDSGSAGAGVGTGTGTGTVTVVDSLSSPVVTRKSRANSVKRMVHRIVETLVPKVQFDPLHVHMAGMDTAGGDTSNINRRGNGLLYGRDVETGNNHLESQMLSKQPATSRSSFIDEMPEGNDNSLLHSVREKEDYKAPAFQIDTESARGSSKEKGVEKGKGKGHGTSLFSKRQSVAHGEDSLNDSLL